MQMTPAFVRYRLHGLVRDSNGNVFATHQIMVKLSRPEVAQIFLSPAPERLVTQLLEAKQISTEQA